jgi:uncharacterized protein YjbI with pentapeptide repeats
VGHWPRSNFRIEYRRFAKADLRAIRAFYVNFTGADMRFADFRGAQMDGTTIIDSKSRLVWQILNQNAGFGADLHGKDLSSTELVGADFRGANLTNALCTPIICESANFGSANLTKANFNSGDFIGATLTNANLTQVNFIAADFTNANLRDATTNGAIFSGATFNKPSCRTVPFEIFSKILHQFREAAIFADRIRMIAKVADDLDQALLLRRGA